MAKLLPLFPLQLVVFPGSAAPLHIFEERYREMVGEAEAAGSEFGIVLAREGGIVKTGCTVIVESVLERYSDGRFDVLTRGQRRFEILALDEERAWLRAEVRYFEDHEEPVPAADLRERAWQAWTALQQEANAAGEPLAGGEPDRDDPLLSFQLAPAIEDLDLQSMLLMSRSESERLQHIARFAPRYLERRQYVAKMKTLAPRNGSGHKFPES